MSRCSSIKISRMTQFRFVSVFFVALTVIATEIVAFQALSFVNDYMTAIQVISTALLGISLGGVVSFFVPKQKSDFVSTVVLWFLPLAIMISFPIIIRLNDSPMLMMALLALPYFLASLYISIAFNEHSADHVYLVDLVGAGVGAIIAVVAVPLLREEGSFFLLGLIGAVPVVISVFGTHHANSIVLKITSTIPGLLAVGLLAAHISVDPFNMVWTATADKEIHGDKVFNMTKSKEGTVRWRLLHSKGSLIERIDIMQKVGLERILFSVYNGRRVDGMTPTKSELGVLDYRLPTRLRLGENPDALLVGPSGQGLCKAVQGLGNGRIDAVEINGAIANLMADKLMKASGNAYDRLNLTIGDVRTFIERSNRKYDFITMLNTHRIWSMGHTGAPEYIHSIEAMREFIDHLTDKGFLIIEERNINEQADLGIRRLLRTAMTALQETGVEDATKHVMIWERNSSCSDHLMFNDQSRCNQKKLFTFIGIKKTPITDAEYADLMDWRKMFKRPAPNRSVFVWRYLPQMPTKHYWTDVVQKEELYQTPNTDPKLHNLSIITDDKPFPFDVFLARKSAIKALKNVSVLAILMVLLPAIIAFVALRRKDAFKGKSKRLGLNAVMIAYFGILGIGYLTIEMVLIQKFGFFLSSPIYSMATILCAMLIFSGLGGYVFGKVTPQKGLLVFIALVVVGGIAWLMLGPTLAFLIKLPFALRILAAIVVVAPISFLMGVPFPFALSLSKSELTPSHAGLFFGINGALGAVASPLTVILSMTIGFQLTLLVGVGAYFICGLLLLSAVPLLRSNS